MSTTVNGPLESLDQWDDHVRARYRADRKKEEFRVYDENTPQVVRDFYLLNHTHQTLDFVLGHTQPGIIVLGSNWQSAIEVSTLIDRLLALGKTVVLIMPLLNIGFDVPQRWVENQLRAGKAIDEWKVPADPGLMMSDLRSEIVRLLEKHSSNPRLVTVDPSTVVCEQDDCYLVRNGQANFRDTAHISNLNAMQFKGVFEAAFRSALRAGDGAEKKRD